MCVVISGKAGRELGGRNAARRSFYYTTAHFVAVVVTSSYRQCRVHSKPQVDHKTWEHSENGLTGS